MKHQWLTAYWQFGIPERTPTFFELLLPQFMGHSIHAEWHQLLESFQVMSKIQQILARRTK